MRKAFLLLLLAAAAGGGYFAWQYAHRAQGPEELVLYGNVDLREVDLAFVPSERIAAVLVEEGDRVAPGQVLARLETTRLKAALDRAKAREAAMRFALQRLENGTRPEEIEQARANVRAAETDVSNAQDQNDRYSKLVETRAISEQTFEDAKAALATAKARLDVNSKALDLALAGPRKEDIDEARASLQAAEADVASAQQDLDDADLRCPTRGTIRTRLLEPGDLASPQKPVFAIAVADPKWVRAYIPEPQLGRIRPGMPCSIGGDTFEGKRYAGWVGFISPVAEFTPKNVETTQLRTQLVYEVRVFVQDPGDELRLGMPVTVRPGEAAATEPATAPVTAEETTNPRNAATPQRDLGVATPK